MQHFFPREIVALSTFNCSSYLLSNTVHFYADAVKKGKYYQTDLISIILKACYIDLKKARTSCIN